GEGGFAVKLHRYDETGRLIISPSMKGLRVHGRRPPQPSRVVGIRRRDGQNCRTKLPASGTVITTASPPKYARCLCARGIVEMARKEHCAVRGGGLQPVPIGPGTASRRTGGALL